MNYYLIVKTGNDDFEYSAEATDKEDAIDMFMGISGLPERLVQRNIACDKCINTLKKCTHERI